MKSEGNDVCGYTPLDLVGGRLAAPRWSLPTLVFVVIALAVLIWDCGDMCMLLLGRIELPQITQASRDVSKKLILRSRFSQEKVCVQSLHVP